MPLNLSRAPLPILTPPADAADLLEIVMDAVEEGDRDRIEAAWARLFDGTLCRMVLAAYPAAGDTGLANRPTALALIETPSPPSAGNTLIVATLVPRRRCHLSALRVLDARGEVAVHLGLAANLEAGAAYHMRFHVDIS